MLHFLIQRIAQSFGVMLVISLLVFFGVYAVGNPVDILVSPQADQQEIARTTAALGLDKPLWQQYGLFLQNAATGHLGNSFVHGSSALNLILERMPATLELASVAMLMALVLGIPLGLWAGLYPEKISSKLITTGSIIGFSLPTFWVGLILVMVFAVQLGWLPESGRGSTVNLFGVPLSVLTLDGWRHILLPALNLALFKIALVIRLTRSSAREILPQDYIRLARAKGLSEARIVGVHVLKNILIPIITVVGLEFGSLIAFAVITESIFSWPGMGKLLIDSITLVDRPVVVAYVLLVVAIYTLINFVVDAAYVLLDPRVHYQSASV